MLLLLLIFSVHFLFGQIIENSRTRLGAYILNALLLAVVFYFTLGVRDTNDNFMFEWFYYNDWDKIDPMFIYLGRVMNYFHFDYHAFYQVHLVVYTLMYLLFISKFTKNYFYVFLVFFVLYYVPYINQIRYYLSFPFFLLSLYYFVQVRRWFWFILFTFLAVVSHSAIVLLYTFLPLYYFLSTKRFFSTSLVLSGVAFVVMLVLFNLGIAQQIEHFGEYFDKGMTSSVAGGFFNAVPYFIYIIYLWYVDRKYKRAHPDFEMDKTYSFLSKLSFYTIIFIPASFFVQVLGHRYVFPFLIVWLIFLLYTMRNESRQEKLLRLGQAMMVHLAVGFAIYLLPYMVLGKSFYVEEMVKGLKSVKYFDYHYFSNFLQ